MAGHARHDALEFFRHCGLEPQSPFHWLVSPRTISDIKLFVREDTNQGRIII